tara:strand:+ start:16191 stop:18143 length:1953 start_codon:yes stop_codon:yes gene_type:complete
MKYRSRIGIIGSLIILFWVLLCVRLFKIQVFQGEEHRTKLIAQSHRKESIFAERGNIYDRNNDALTRNIAHYTISVNPKKITNKTLLAKELQNVTGKDFNYYTDKLNSKRNFIFLERNIKNDVLSNKKLSSIKGLNINKQYRRAYPHGSIAGQILGYTDTDDIGISGIEKDYNKFLSGTSGHIIKSKGWTGKYQHKSGLPNVPAINGDNIKLTIDLNYQSILQEELERRRKETNAISAMGIIMNPQTGAILAMASLPNFDNNYFSKYKVETHHSRVITDQFEPGSTFKIVAAVAGLTEKKISLTEEFNCENGAFDYFGYKIKDHESYGQLTLSQIIKHSSNIGVIKIAEKIGSKALYKYARDFGFGLATNLGLNGETSGTLKPEKKWSKISVGQISMGHEVAVSTLQLATAFSAIANDGYLVKPYIVEHIIDQNSKVIIKNNIQIKRKISTENIMKELKKMLRQVVDSGTGIEADIEGWEVAGKTGTAQKYINGKYSNEHFISNFVGFLPASKPQLLSAIILDEPDSPMHWGGQGAAVAFKRIMQRIINMDDKISPPLKNQIKKKINKYLVSNKKKKNNSYPIPMQLNTINTKKGVRVPDVRGKSLKKAMNIISDAGLKPLIQGSGKVISQNPSPGTIMHNKIFCTLQLQ